MSHRMTEFKDGFMIQACLCAHFIITISDAVAFLLYEHWWVQVGECKK